MKNVLFIDPGNFESGWVGFDVSRGIKAPPTGHGKARNEKLAQLLKTSAVLKLVVLEKLIAYGMSKQSVIDTAEFCGEVKRICKDRGIPVVEITRTDVKDTVLCGGSVNDSQIRDAVARHWGVEVINNRLTGILKGYVKDEIQALALGLAYMKQIGVK